MNQQIINGLLAQIELIRSELGDYDADEILRADMLEGETNADDILRMLVKSLNIARADEAGAKAALDDIKHRYEARISSAQRRQETARTMIGIIMEGTGLSSRKLPEGAISVQAGRKSLSLADDFTPPQGLQIVEIKPDRKAILDALARGDKIDGADIVIGKKIVTVR